MNYLTRWARVSLLFAVVLLAACSGGGGAATSQTISPKVVDQLAADVAALQVTDLPERFSSHSSSSSADTPESRNPNECLDPPDGQSSNSSDDVVAEVEREFAIGLRLDAIIVTGRVQLFRDVAIATSTVSAFGRSAVTDCLKSLYAEQLTAVGGTVGDVAITASKVAGLGDEQAGFVLSFVVTLDQVDHPFAAEFDFTRVGRAGLTVSVFSPRGLDHSLAVMAMTAMVNRLQ
jgi:hypothetical protein